MLSRAAAYSHGWKHGHPLHTSGPLPRRSIPHRPPRPELSLGTAEGPQAGRLCLLCGGGILPRSADVPSKSLQGGGRQGFRAACLLHRRGLARFAPGERGISDTDEALQLPQAGRIMKFAVSEPTVRGEI